jgi:hypothetical protein
MILEKNGLLDSSRPVFSKIIGSWGWWDADGALLYPLGYC